MSRRSRAAAAAAARGLPSPSESWEGVRVVAVTKDRPYAKQWRSEGALVVLHGGADSEAAQPSRLGLRLSAAAAIAAAALHANSVTHAFLLDASDLVKELPAEQATRGGPGPVSKPIGRVLSKLNLTGASYVAGGGGCPVVIKALDWSTAGLLVLIQPVFHRGIRADQDIAAQAEQCRVHALFSSEALSKATSPQLQTLLPHATIEVLDGCNDGRVAAHIAQLLLAESTEGSEGDSSLWFAEVKFSLNAFSKQMEQTIVDATPQMSMALGSYSHVRS
eukprot:jgi/Chlat1/836/Chrsp104S01176